MEEIPIDERDIAVVAVRALSEASLAGGDQVLTGPEALSHARQVAVIGEVLGRRLAFHELSPDDFRRKTAAEDHGRRAVRFALRFEHCSPSRVMDGKAAKRLFGRDRTDIWIAVGYRVRWWTLGVLVFAALSGPGCGSNRVSPTGDDSGVGSMVDAGVVCAPILDQSGQDTGLDTCTDGNVQRRASIQCSWPATSPVPVCATNTCASDSDCPGFPPSEPKGYCAQAHNLAGYCGCLTGCHQDADCGPGWICECGVIPFGRCVMAQCTTNADCGAGFACVATVVSTPASPCIPASSHSPTLFVCQTAADSCRGSTDCIDDGGATNMCLYDGTRLVCGFCETQV